FALAVPDYDRWSCCWPLVSFRIGYRIFDFNPQIPSGLPAALWILFQAADEQLANSRTDIRGQPGEIGLAHDDRCQHFGDILATEGLAAGEHLIKDAADRKHVAAMIGVPTSR